MRCGVLAKMPIPDFEVIDFRTSLKRIRVDKVAQDAMEAKYCPIETTKLN